jgi:riboflavin synthase alpha subunit
VGDQLNLERAMGAHVRFGGHFVQVRSEWLLFSVSG